jgi:hypothetical protein
MTKAKFLPLLCPAIRTKNVTHSSLNIMTGERGPERHEIVTEACGAPLFGNDREIGLCRHCAAQAAG